MSKISLKLNATLNKHISHLCTFSIGKDNSKNHCAHFVSHVMGYELNGATCKNFTWTDKQKKEKGATFRVDDLFNKSSKTGFLIHKPSNLTECLIFVTLASNITKSGGNLLMGNQPKKHIGILSKGKVWNYSNTNNIIVADLLESFKNKFIRLYNTKGTTVEFYYGKFL